MSYIVYIGLLVFCWIFAHLASKHEKQGYVRLIILALTLIAGLRHYSVGLDTLNYVMKFDLISKGAFSLAYGLEESFKYIVYWFLKVIPDMTLLLTLLAFITNWCIINRFWELRKISSFTCMVLCYYMAFYFMTFNAMRQFVAVGVVFYCTRYLEQRKILRFMLGVGIAMLFHQSALIGFVFLALNCIRWKELNRNQKLFYVFVVIASPAVIIIALRLFARYAKYFNSLSLDIGFILPLKLVFLAGSALFLFTMYYNYGYFRNGHLWNQQDQYNARITVISYFVALILAMVGYLFPYADRICFCFYLFECVYYGMLLRGKKTLNRILFGYFIAFIMSCGFIYSILHNSQGNMPYLFVWQ